MALSVWRHASILRRPPPSFEVRRHIGWLLASPPRPGTPRYYKIRRLKIAFWSVFFTTAFIVPRLHGARLFDDDGNFAPGAKFVPLWAKESLLKQESMLDAQRQLELEEARIAEEEKVKKN